MVKPAAWRHVPLRAKGGDALDVWHAFVTVVRLTTPRGFPKGGDFPYHRHDGSPEDGRPGRSPEPLRAAYMSERGNQEPDIPGGKTSTGVVVKPRPKTKKPSMYKVLMLNDDYTPMEFVVHVLESFFGKSREEATRIMLHVHQRGVGVCGVYTYEIAETKVTQVIDYARKHQHPLQCTLEKE
jgi:ATP-dependent Clp protease adaptor protein ClpS